MDKGGAKDRQHATFNWSGVAALNQETPLEFHQMKRKIILILIYIAFLDTVIIQNTFIFSIQLFFKNIPDLAITTNLRDVSCALL